MPVQIHITGENAQEAIQEFATLSAAFVGAVAPTPAPVVQTPAAVVEPEKSKRQPRRTKQDESEAAEHEEPSKQEESTKQEALKPDAIEMPTESRFTAEQVKNMGNAYVSSATSFEDRKERTKAIKGLLNKYCVAALTQVAEKDRDAFIADLQEIIGDDLPF